MGVIRLFMFARASNVEKGENIRAHLTGSWEGLVSKSSLIPSKLLHVADGIVHRLGITRASDRCEAAK